MQDEQTASAAPAPLPLSRDEKRVLELHDRLQQLQLEIALLTAQKKYAPGSGSSATGDDANAGVEAAKKVLLESRSRYVLRNQVAESVIAANPILQAVHNGTRASPIERDLLPLLHSRDDLSSTLAWQAAEQRSLLVALTEVEGESLRLGRENVDLAARVLELASRADRERAEALAGAGARPGPEIAQLEAEVRRSRRRWRALRGVASAVVAGSGVDWAADPVLRDVVLDPEDDDDFVV
ncbi:centromere protein H (CENP-H)-domain-containing protein [Durotheca rogersii]|uniref:centromere protein H (CENP-H)-domain-containing protein n=1 Tax=Durotheca rogersii TaxID=419775 RepID=UPI00221FD987|nr:centromere protein H (CENP-H)-domain-containing protein [Durotheca rogersii]KAI5868209.1 centromere protein H (CENP-H)-domain-containing protein [Durotheca rogersii]